MTIVVFIIVIIMLLLTSKLIQRWCFIVIVQDSFLHSASFINFFFIFKAHFFIFVSVCYSAEETEIKIRDAIYDDAMNEIDTDQ